MPCLSERLSAELQVEGEDYLIHAAGEAGTNRKAAASPNAAGKRGGSGAAGDARTRPAVLKVGSSTLDDSSLTFSQKAGTPI
jgi:hypothetical protein